MNISSRPIKLTIAALATCLSVSLFAAAPDYKVDRSFGQGDMKSGPVSIALDGKDQLYVLLNNGTVMSYDADGKKTASFQADMKPTPVAMTVADGKIYLLNAKTTVKEIEFQGKKVKRIEPSGIGCSVYDAAGTKISDVNLPVAVSVVNAHFVGKELVVSDYKGSQLVYFEINGTEGKVTRKITKAFRLCCGIFDFCPGPAPDSLVVANLGAFKVQTFTNGVKSAEFGQRGERAAEFQGCCNPVNVACLADGSVVTVEKDPTRVKIYAKDGKSFTKITGLSELVAGCSTIPTAVDSKGSIYLASAIKKCVVKCVPDVKKAK